MRPSVMTIEAGDHSAKASFVPEKGGAGCSLILPAPGGPREMLFLHDFFWDPQTEKIPGGWPFLFPICARLERGGVKGDYLHDGKHYSLPSHGFGPRMPWRVVEQTKSELAMRLEDTAETRAAYPFSFEVTLRYRVDRGALLCEQTYRNRGDRRMPYYAGFHPYFLTPPVGQGKENVTLDFKPVRAFRYKEGFTDLAGPAEVPPVPLAVTSKDVAEQRLTRVGQDRETRIRMPDGLVIHMAAEGVEDPDLFPYVQLYTMPDKPFFCVEPWMAFPNALNTAAGSRWLEPGQLEHGLMRVWTSW